jgi:hypothetical protein
MDESKLKKQWLSLSGAGLALTGFGACLIAEAAMMKFSHAPTIEWILAGTVALIVFNSGLSVFGMGIVKRAAIERLNTTKKE